MASISLVRDVIDTLRGINPTQHSDLLGPAAKLNNGIFNCPSSVELLFFCLFN